MGERGISAADLSRQLEIARSTVSHWLNCKTAIDVATLGDIADYLKVPLIELARDADDEAKRPVVRPLEDPDETLVKQVARRIGVKIRIEH